MKIIFEEGYEAEAVYYPEEDVWHSEDFPSDEWGTQREMRKDMLVHFICEDYGFKPMWFLECYDEDDVREVFNNIMTTEE